MNTWEIDSITSVPNFLAAVAQFLPEAHTVSFEVRGACSAARAFYAKHESPVKNRPCRDTLFPRTQLHYCTVSPALAHGLDDLLRSHDIKEVFWHVKGFGDRRLLFSIHDADIGDPAYLSGHIDGKVVRHIGSAIGCKPTKLETQYDWDGNHRQEKRS